MGLALFKIDPIIFFNRPNKFNFKLITSYSLLFLFFWKKKELILLRI